jgi:hypothetical protein
MSAGFIGKPSIAKRFHFVHAHRRQNCERDSGDDGDLEDDDDLEKEIQQNKDGSN